MDASSPQPQQSSLGSTAPPAPAPPTEIPLTASPHSMIPVFQDLAQLRRWRRRAREQKKSVGVVPTMGALHDGHLNLVRQSIANNPFTVLTLFINPTQFAPHEDLASYPRTLPRDLELLRTVLPPPYVAAYGERYRRAWGTSAGMLGLGVSESDPIRWVFSSEQQQQQQQQQGRRARSPPAGSSGPAASYPSETLESPLVVFAPQRETMYPLSTISAADFLDETDALGEQGETVQGEAMLQDTSRQRGAFVEVKGWGDVLEGEARPQFFRGVATVCTKLFNAVEPDHAYFGQKDIQQALLLKLMLKDLLSNSPSSENLHIIPTSRDPTDSLALSSRNAYLTPTERTYAPTLFRALSIAREHLASPSSTVAEALTLAEEHILRIAADAAAEGVQIRLDHVDAFERTTFRRVRGPVDGKEVVLVGAVWVGRTRLIDNLLVGWQV